MENKLIERFKTTKKAITFLKKAIDDYKDLKDKRYVEHLRNSKIQSLEFSVDTLWKFLLIYFTKTEGKELKPTPKTVFRYCLQADLTNKDETELLLEMVDSRNLSSHTYHEDLAETLNENIEEYYELMKKILDKVEKLLIIEK
ncbi:nucleotidyltransferase substrate binding protein [Candidatus Babeliales bacterium]|nr:nucleotidyltransferase substrate binding protein [Candidatus Babeliales bacterium]